MMIQTHDILDDVVEFDWDFIRSKADLIHSIHPYPAKFIPEIPEAIFSKFVIPEKTIVFDPFCGSGVTLTEARRAGYDAVGVDLNPIACLISRVKTMTVNFDIVNEVDKIINKAKTRRGKIAVPPIPNVDHWFKKEVQKALTLLIDEIEKFKTVEKKDVFKFCLSSIIVKVSNQDSDTRYAAVEKAHKFEDVFRFFRASAVKLARAKAEPQNATSVKVVNKDSLRITKTDLGRKIGMVVTSPPYPNAYEYWLYHKYRMWWLGYDPIDVKEHEIGARPHYFKKNHHTEIDFVNQMTTLLNFIYRNSISQAYLIFVIGRSKIHGQIVNNDEIIEQAGRKIGFEHLATVERNINLSRKSFNLSHARIKQEYLVILRKP